MKRRFELSIERPAAAKRTKLRACARLSGVTVGVGLFGLLFGHGFMGGGLGMFGLLGLLLQIFLIVMVVRFLFRFFTGGRRF